MQNTKTYTFMTSLLTFYLKGKIEVSETSVSLSAPNTILKFIPLGSRRFEPMVSQIASVNSSFHLDLKSFVIGIFIAFFGLSLIVNYSATSYRAS